MSATRGGGFGPAPITFQEIAAWSQLLDIQPHPWEVEQLLRLDNLWFKAYGERDKSKKKSSKKDS